MSALPLPSSRSASQVQVQVTETTFRRALGRVQDLTDMQHQFLLSRGAGGAGFDWEALAADYLGFLQTVLRGVPTAAAGFAPIGGRTVGLLKTADALVLCNGTEPFPLAPSGTSLVPAGAAALCLQLEAAAAKWDHARGSGWLAPTPSGPGPYVYATAVPREGRAVQRVGTVLGALMGETVVGALRNSTGAGTATLLAVPGAAVEVGFVGDSMVQSQAQKWLEDAEVCPGPPRGGGHSTGWMWGLHKARRWSKCTVHDPLGTSNGHARTHDA